jgi:hypothetical protein
MALLDSRRTGVFGQPMIKGSISELISQRFFGQRRLDHLYFKL